MEVVTEQAAEVVTEPNICVNGKAGMAGQMLTLLCYTLPVLTPTLNTTVLPTTHPS